MANLNARRAIGIQSERAIEKGCGQAQPWCHGSCQTKRSVFSRHTGNDGYICDTMDAAEERG